MKNKFKYLFVLALNLCLVGCSSETSTETKTGGGMDLHPSQALRRHHGRVSPGGLSVLQHAGAGARLRRGGRGRSRLPPGRFRAERAGLGGGRMLPGAGKRPERPGKRGNHGAGGE